MVTCRRGHSLPELIVAATLLAILLAAATGSTWLGARWADRAVWRQAAVRIAVATLDSVVRSPTPVPGSDTVGALVVRWLPDAGDVVVRVEGPDGEPVVTLRGRPVPDVPVLPDSP